MQREQGDGEGATKAGCREEMQPQQWKCRVAVTRQAPHAEKPQQRHRDEGRKLPSLSGLVQPELGTCSPGGLYQYADMADCGSRSGLYTIITTQAGFKAVRADHQQTECGK